jgi:hypothetical protein
MFQKNADGSYKVPVRPLHTPLTPDDEAALNAIATHHPVIADFLARCHNCGLDVQQQIGQVEAQAAFVGKVKQHFFPDQLPTGSV